MNRPPITVRGAAKLREELKRLKQTDRPNVIQAIAEARAHGDLKENAEYHAAKEQQSFIEGRIAELQENLGRAQLIEPATVDAKGKVVFGATVDVVSLETDEATCYQIVGELEADISAGLISINSPIARALIGKEEGDEIVVQAPAGDREYEIVAVRYV